MEITWNEALYLGKNTFLFHGKPNIGSSQQSYILYEIKYGNNNIQTYIIINNHSHTLSINYLRMKHK